MNGCQFPIHYCLIFQYLSTILEDMELRAKIRAPKNVKIKTISLLNLLLLQIILTDFTK